MPAVGRCALLASWPRPPLARSAAAPPRDGRALPDMVLRTDHGEHVPLRNKTWVYGGLRIGDGQAVTCCAPSRNSVHWQAFLARLEQANPTGTIAVITDNLSSHSSLATRAWLTGHPRIEQVFIPKGACWLNL